MNKSLLSVVVIGLLLGVLGAGCYSTVEGDKHTGIPWSKDRIEGRYERPVEQVYAAARKVLEQTGTLRGDNTVNKTLEGRVDTRSVWVKVDEVEPNLTRVVVQARSRNGGADIALAAELEKRIALELK